MNLERAWYEALPYMYVIFAVVVMAFTESRLGLVSSALLLAVSACIIRLRWAHRRQ